VFGLPSVAALAIRTKVERAGVTRCHAADPLVAGLARLDARLDAIRGQLVAAAAVSDVADLEEILAHAAARIEEWTA
jgi:hypothetical protein